MIYVICTYIYIYISYINKWTIPIISDLQRQLFTKHSKIQKRDDPKKQANFFLNLTATQKAHPNGVWQRQAYHLIVWQLVVFLIDPQISRCLPAEFHRCSRAVSRWSSLVVLPKKNKTLGVESRHGFKQT